MMLKDIIITLLALAILGIFAITVVLLDNLGETESFVAAKCADSNGKDEIMINGRPHICWPVGKYGKESENE